MRHRIRYLAVFAAVLAAGVLLSFFREAGSEAKPAGNGKKLTSIKIQNKGDFLLLNKREKKKLRVKVQPKSVGTEAVTWKSSRKSVVTVSKKGVVRGKRYGKATITASAADGSKTKAKLRVLVGRRVTRVSLTADHVKLDVKGSAKLQANVFPANATKQNLSYHSSDKSVVSVSSKGVLRGKAEGKAKITVSAKDGSGKKAVCSVQVSIPSRSVIVDADSYGTKLEVGKKFTIGVSVLPMNATNRGVRFASTDPKVAKVSQSGVVTGLEVGTTTIQAMAADGRSSAAVEVEVYKVELRDKKLVAHRGLSSEAPENTSKAFELAVKQGFYGIECDVRKTLDDQFVIMHDADLSRMCGKNLTIANMDLRQLKKYPITSGANATRYPGLTVPTVEEYLDILAASSTVHPFIELKEPFTKAELQKIVRKVKESGLLERTYFISMYKQNLLSLKEIGVATKENLQYVYGAEEENKTQAVNDSVINWCIANEINLDVRYTLVTASDVFRLHEAGREVNVWTINQLEKAFELLTDTQVDMLTTEYYLNS